MTKDGKPYAPIRYKEIVTECFSISKYCNTSYTDLMKITPLERKYMVEFIAQESEKNKKIIEESKAKINKAKK